MTDYSQFIPRARIYLLAEIKAGNTDSGLPQRFVEWARSELGGTLSDKEGIALFLSCCESEGIAARIVANSIVYGLGRADPLAG
jgi:hypothetical protein